MNTMMYYYLDNNHNPVPTDDTKKAFEGDRRVSLNYIGDVKISTVFLGMEHGYVEGKPIIFETMIFGGEYDEYQARYCTWNEALEGHERAVKLVKGEK